MAIDGGRIAARGFQYQYWRTLEVLVDLAEKPETFAVRVEGPSDSNAVDFDVLDSAGRCTLAAQVKSRSPGGQMGAVEALSILLNFIEQHDAQEYHLLTNSLPGAKFNLLADALLDDGPIESLRTRLREIFEGSPRRLAQIENLSSENLARLQRSRLIYDPRDDDEIRHDLRSAVRAHRIRHNSAIGDHSAGILIGHLTSEILRRAASSEISNFSVGELKRLISIDSDELARIAGTRDWGIVVGGIPFFPDVVRQAPLDKLIEIFGSHPSRGLRHAALVGLSGIGKSSLAAAYIAARADYYDLIMWVDGATRATLTTSFHQVMDVLRGPGFTEELGANHIRLQGAVHAELSRLPGRWMMVVDNISDMRLVNSWLPSAGNGDLLITSTDAVARYGSVEVVELGVMENSEAVELLARRFDLDSEDQHRHRDILERLAEEMGAWPLALELAAGYMRSCEISLIHLDHYLNLLKLRSLSDDSSLPPGYPRTLALILRLILDHLRRNADTSSEGMPYFLAYTIVVSSAYLSSRQVPIHLAGAVLSDTTDEESKRHRGPIMLHPSAFPLAEAIREIRRFSLVSYDDDIPPGLGGRSPDSERTISINSVVQEITRSEVEALSDLANLLDRLAEHVEKWLTSALEMGNLDRAFIMLAHAESLFGHVRRLELTSANFGLLGGNLAQVYLAKGNFAAADNLLEAEIEFFRDGPYVNELLVVQAKIGRARIFFESREDSGLDFIGVIQGLEHLFFFVQREAINYPAAAAELSMKARTLIAQAPRGLAEDPALRNLDTAFADMLKRVPSTPFTQAIDDMEKVSQMLRSGRSEEAEVICRRVLDMGALGATELEARRLLIETLVHTGQWEKAREETHSLLASYGSAPFLTDVVSVLIHNVGAACGVIALLHDDVEVRSLFLELLDAPVFARVFDAATGGRKGRLRLLRVVRQILEGRAESAWGELEQISLVDLDEDEESELDAWAALLEFIQGVARRRLNETL